MVGQSCACPLTHRLLLEPMPERPEHFAGCIHVVHNKPDVPEASAIRALSVEPGLVAGIVPAEGRVSSLGPPVV